MFTPSMRADGQRMGWGFPWAPSARSDFNFDFGVSLRDDQLARGAEVNFRPIDFDVAALPHGGTPDDPVVAGGSPV